MVDVAPLGEALAAADEMADFGAAEGTLDKDDRAWDFWVSFCRRWHWDPLISVEEATTRPESVSQKLALFLLWVYPLLKGRHQTVVKAQSAFAYPKAIIRIFARRKVPMPRAKELVSELNGLQRMYKDMFSARSAAPKRKNPMLPKMWQRVRDLPEGAALPGPRLLVE